MRRPTLHALLLVLALAVSATADDVTGWRGNWTGLWPDTHPPVEWYRIPKGEMEHLRATRDQPGPGRKPAIPPQRSRHFGLAPPGRVYHEAARTRLGQGSASTPCFIGDHILIRDGQYLYCVGER